MENTITWIRNQIPNINNQLSEELDIKTNLRSIIVKSVDASIRFENVQRSTSIASYVASWDILSLDPKRERKIIVLVLEHK